MYSLVNFYKCLDMGWAKAVWERGLVGSGRGGSCGVELKTESLD
jgi:hypothetical protein